MANVTCLVTSSVRFRVRKMYAKCIALQTHVLLEDKRGIDRTAHQVPREREKTVHRNARFVPVLKNPLTYFLIDDKRGGVSFYQAFPLETAGICGYIL